MQIADEGDQPGDRAGIDAAGDLVEQEQPRPGGQRARQLEALALARRQPAGVRGRAVAEPTRSARPAALRAASTSAVPRKAPIITFSSAVIPWKGRSFWKVRPTPSRQIWSGRSRVASRPSMWTCRRPAGEASDQVEQRRLAGAVGADDAHQLPRAHREGDRAVGHDAAEALCEPETCSREAHAADSRRAPAPAATVRRRPSCRARPITPAGWNTAISMMSAP